MSWGFIRLVRRTYQGDDNWGDLYLINSTDHWQKFGYSYELPWKEFDEGSLKGKSKNNESRIALGVYELKSRADGAKGWRLELQNTQHRTNIQIHRAHSSLFIQGCILPLNFNDFSKDQLSKGDTNIQTQSVALMTLLKSRYDALKTGKVGPPTVEISAKLPPYEPKALRTRNA